MCTNGRGKLVAVADELDSTYSELRKTKEKLIESENTRKLAEDNYDKVCQRNMRLTETSNTSILWMMYTFFVAALSIGYMVYSL